MIPSSSDPDLRFVKVLCGCLLSAENSVPKWSKFEDENILMFVLCNLKVPSIISLQTMPVVVFGLTSKMLARNSGRDL